jgi:hypothetical protein
VRNSLVVVALLHRQASAHQSATTSPELGRTVRTRWNAAN